MDSKQFQILVKYLFDNNIINEYLDISRITGVHKSNLSAYMNGTKPSRPFTLKFIEKFNLSEIYKKLFNSNETTLITNAPTSEPLTPNAHQVSHDNYMEIPYLPIIAQAGNTVGFADATNDFDTILVPKEFEKGNYLVIEIDGDSMNDNTERAICDGDKILCKEIDLKSFLNKNINFNRTLFVIVCPSGALCKQILSINDNDITAHSWNVKHKDKIVKFTDIKQIFAVRKIVEKKIKF